MLGWRTIYVIDISLLLLLLMLMLLCYKHNFTPNQHCYCLPSEGAKGQYSVSKPLYEDFKYQILYKSVKKKKKICIFLLLLVSFHWRLPLHVLVEMHELFECMWKSINRLLTCDDTKHYWPIVILWILYGWCCLYWPLALRPLWSF